MSPSVLAHLLPGIGRLRRYERRRFGCDALAGVTVAAYLVPQVMGYATVAGLPVVAGLWAILAALSVYILVGSSPQLSVGPESTTALMTAVARRAERRLRRCRRSLAAGGRHRRRRVF